MIATLPNALSRALEAELGPFSRAAIQDATERLTTAYRAQSGGIAKTLSPTERAAYLAVRFPSTFASAGVAWRALEAAYALGHTATVLDAGAGPGTASLAASEIVPNARFSLIERDIGWRPIAERLATAAGIGVSFRAGALPAALEPHDIVVTSYALNELSAADLPRAIEALWKAAKHALIVLEPGTPRGFAVINTVRTQTLAAGAHAAAPCTHDRICPMSTRDWCHQPVRVARTNAHRSAKQGTLAFEDEKFSYVVMTREPPLRGAAGRIVRKPMRNAGHVHLDLCSEGALSRTTIGRSDKQRYRAARDATWGGTWPPDQAD
jgi:ribosomal protein RSM22 (predicted rRNA methylase)